MFGRAAAAQAASPASLMAMIHCCSRDSGAADRVNRGFDASGQNAAAKMK